MRQFCDSLLVSRFLLLRLVVEAAFLRHPDQIFKWVETPSLPASRAELRAEVVREHIAVHMIESSEELVKHGEWIVCDPTSERAEASLHASAEGLGLWLPGRLP